MINNIDTYKQHLDLIDDIKSKGCKASNLYMFSDDIEKLIKLNKWKYLSLDNGLLFLDDNDSFYRCYYFLNVDEKYDYINFDKDVVIEFPFNNELRDRQLKQIDKLYELGFILGRQSSEMFLKKEDINKININCNVEYADIDDIDQISNILINNFNPLYSFLPNKEELINSIKINNVYVVKEFDKVVGILCCDFDNNKAYIRQVAIDKQYRNKGYGLSLIGYFINDKQANEYLHWVDINNDKAISIYRKFGYNFSIKKANEYIWRVNDER